MYLYVTPAVAFLSVNNVPVVFPRFCQPPLPVLRYTIYPVAPATLPHLTVTPLLAFAVEEILGVERK